MQTSCGTLLYRRREGGLEVLIVRPGGFAAKYGWSIPKGLVDPGEDFEATARRETREETGVDPGPLVPLGHIDYTKSKKRVFAFAAPLPEGQTPRCAQWEIDRAEMMSVDDARRVIHPDQAAFLDRLLKELVHGDHG